MLATVNDTVLEQLAEAATTDASETTASNAGGSTVLERLGFDLTPADDSRGTRALLDLEPQL